METQRYIMDTERLPSGALIIGKAGLGPSPWAGAPKGDDQLMWSTAIFPLKAAVRT